MKLRQLLPLVFLAGCASLDRGCSSCSAQSFGADWIIVQYRMDGVPMNCWKLEATSVSNEQQSDGIYWKEPSGHLVHIAGWYNRVQVQGKNFAGAAKSIGIDLDRCKEGRYVAAPASSP